MIDYKKIKESLNNRGVKFTPIEYSFAIMVGIGLDKYQSYLTTIKAKELEKCKNEGDADKLLESIKSECDGLLINTSLKEVVNCIKSLYKMKLQSDMLNLEDVELSKNDIKKIITTLLKNRTDNIDGSSAKEIIELIKTYLNNFATSDNLSEEFNRTFIQVIPPYNAVCSNCNKEFSLPPNVSGICPHCGQKYIYDQEKDKFIY